MPIDELFKIIIAFLLQHKKVAIPAVLVILSSLFGMQAILVKSSMGFLPRFILYLGVGGISAFFTFLIYGIAKMSVISPILNSLLIIIFNLIGHFLYGEDISPFQKVGVAVCILGVILLSSGGK